MVNGWKVIAIVFIVLFIIENLLLGWAYFSVVEDDKKLNQCYYEICEEFPEAIYEDKLCHCYQYDEEGNLEINKTTLMFDG